MAVHRTTTDPATGKPRSFQVDNLEGGSSVMQNLETGETFFLTVYFEWIVPNKRLAVIGLINSNIALVREWNVNLHSAIKYGPLSGFIVRPEVGLLLANSHLQGLVKYPSVSKGFSWEGCNV